MGSLCMDMNRVGRKGREEEVKGGEEVYCYILQYLVEESSKSSVE